MLKAVTLKAVTLKAVTKNFRGRARKLLAKAKALLATGDDDDLELASLKLRKTMEALTYERTKVYEDDLGPAVWKTWQPKKLMERMLDIDPYADQAATIAIGEEPAPGVQPEKMTVMGTDYVLDMKTIKKHYDALGAYLHTETVDQLEKGKAHNLVKLRKKCDEVAKAAETVLGSRVYNSSMANRGEIECHECGTTIRRRLARDDESRVVGCWECKATYDLKALDDKKVLFEPRMHDVSCINSECDDTFPIWEKELKVGSQWYCRKCGTKQSLALGVSDLSHEDDIEKER